MASWTRELDEAAALATRTGCWHILLFYLLCGLAAVPTSFLVFSQVFTNATPEHWCAPPPELEGLELPDDLVRSLMVPQHDGVYDSCQAYTLEPGKLYAALDDYIEERSELVREGETMQMVMIRQLTPAAGGAERDEQITKVKEAIIGLRSKKPAACTNGWKFSTEHYLRTLTTEEPKSTYNGKCLTMKLGITFVEAVNNSAKREDLPLSQVSMLGDRVPSIDFSLVCDQGWLPRTGNTLFWVGSIFGNLVFGWMSDRYGRRPTILLMILLEVPLAIAASFPTDYWSYVALRIAGGLFFPALYQQPFILALELMAPKQRTYTGIVVGMLFASGMCVLALLAYVVRDWYYLSLATSVPFILLFGYFWLIPESPRWLVGRGRIAEAEKVYRKLAEKNGIELSRGFLLELHKKVKEEDAEAEVTMLSSVNGHVGGFRGVSEKDDYVDRRISNMLTFKPELPKLSDTEDYRKSDNIERIIALEVAEIVNKKARLKKEREHVNEEVKEDFPNEESQLNSEARQKSTQTDPYAKSPENSLRRKSIQLVTKIFIRENEEDDVMENKIMDDQNSEGDQKASPLDVFRYPNIRKKFFLLTFNWVALGVVYNSLSYNTPNLGVDDYLAFFIGGAVELPSYFIAWRCMDKYGRRWVLCVFSNIGGLACISCVFVPEAWPWITVSLAMLGRLCIAASFAVFYVQIGELLPTVLRAQAMGAASFISGLGLLACPYIVYLAVYARSLPLIVMGVLSVAAGVTSLFLPETLNQPLPQTLGDGEIFGRDFKLLSCVERPRRDSIRDLD